jgi:hypothetical protein
MGGQEVSRMGEPHWPGIAMEGNQQRVGSSLSQAETARFVEFTTREADDYAAPSS